MKEFEREFEVHKGGFMKLEKRMKEIEEEFGKTKKTIDAHNNTGQILNRKLIELQARYDELEKLKNGEKKK